MDLAAALARIGEKWEEARMGGGSSAATSREN